MLGVESVAHMREYCKCFAGGGFRVLFCCVFRV